MVRKRDIKATPFDIEKFASQADTPTDSLPNKKGPRKYKSIAVPFNEYEYERLEFASSKTGRSKNSLIRYLIIRYAKEIEEKGELI